MSPLESSLPGQTTRVEEPKRHRVKMKENETSINPLSKRIQAASLMIGCFMLISSIECDKFMVVTGKLGELTQVQPLAKRSLQADQVDEQSVGVKATRRPRFELDSRQVVGSRWQSELYLPCRIFDLDEDQTVSIWLECNSSRIDQSRVAFHLSLFYRLYAKGQIQW